MKALIPDSETGCFVSSFYGIPQSLCHSSSKTSNCRFLYNSPLTDGQGTSHTTWHRRPDNWRMINWNGYERKQSWPTQINPASAWENWRKPHKDYEHRRCLERESNQKPPAFKRQHRETFRTSRRKALGELKKKIPKNELHNLAISSHVLRWRSRSGRERRSESCLMVTDFRPVMQGWESMCVVTMEHCSVERSPVHHMTRQSQHSNIRL